jgi:hypothetical protein
MRIRFSLIFLCLTCVLTATTAVVGQTDSAARFPVYVNKKYGFINELGQMVIQPRFNHVMNFSEGLAAVHEDRHWNYIDTSGKVVIATTASWKVRPFSEGLAAVLFGNRYGYIDKKGEVVIQPQFEKAFDFSEGLARVKLNGQWAFIDKQGRTAFVAPFDDVHDFRSGYAMVAKLFSPDIKLAAGNIKCSYIDKAGKLSPIGWFNGASPFSEGLAFVSNDDNMITSFSQYGLVVDTIPVSGYGGRQHVTYSFFNADGEMLFKGTYQSVGPFAEHRAAVQIKRKVGYINELGEMIIPAEFEAAETFSEGLAFVKLNGEGYFIDTAGSIVFRTDASLMAPFKNGLAQLMSCRVKPCQAVYVDKQGRTVWKGPSE